MHADHNMPNWKYSQKCQLIFILSHKYLITYLFKYYCITVMGEMAYCVVFVLRRYCRNKALWQNQFSMEFKFSIVFD